MSMPTVNRPPAVDKAKADKTRLWVVCCEQTEVTQQISESVAQWQLPEVRSLFTESLTTQASVQTSVQTSKAVRSRQELPILTDAIAQTIAQSDYAIFVTPYPQPSPHIKISPLNVAQSVDGEDADPVALLSAIHSRHGQSPQSWWLQLPTTEVRARRICPVASQKSVAQALNQIGIFIRHYRLANSHRRSATANAKALNNQALNNQPKASAQRLLVSH
jgi:hypothetical protein